MPDNIAIEMLRKYRPRSLKAIAKLPLPKEIKDAMHSQMKVDMVYLGELANERKYGKGIFNPEKLAKSYGPPSYSIDELGAMLDMDEMNKGLGL
jgi:hypothetical protein